jgi:sec-independent protein translocase protein TatA
MFGMGPTEMIIALVVVLLLFGAKRIPEIAGSFGKGIKEFKKNMNDVQSEITRPADRDALPPGAPRETVQHDDAPAKEPKRLL